MEYKDEGNRFFKEQKWELAAEQYTKGLQAGDALPPDARGLLLSNRSQCRLNLQQWQLAEEDADACLRLLPEHTKSLFRRAFAREKLGRTTEALADFARVARAEPQNRPASEAAARLREQVLRQRDQTLDEGLPATLLETLRASAAGVGPDALEKQVDACKRVRGLCVHRGLGSSLLQAGTLEVLVAKAVDSETPPDLREASLAALVTLASGHEAEDEDEASCRPPPTVEGPLPVPPAAAEARSRLHKTLPLPQLRPLCRSHGASARRLAALLGLTHEVEDALALEALHDALSFPEEGELNVPRAAVTALAGMCDRRRRLGKSASAVLPSAGLLKCLESALGTTLCTEPLKALLAGAFALLADEDRPKNAEVDLPSLGLRILEPFLESKDFALKSNGLLGLSTLFAASAKAAASLMQQSAVPFLAILDAIKRPPPSPEGKAAQANAVECLLLATGDNRTRQSIIECGGIDILLAALGDGEEGSHGLMRAKLVAVLAMLAGHNKEVREEVFDRVDFVLELRHALDVAREGAASARAGGKGAPSTDEARRLLRALLESCACLTIHGEFKEALFNAKKTLKAIQDLPNSNDLVDDPQLAFFYASTAYNLCRSREDKVRPKKNEFPYNELDEDDLNAIEEFYEKMPAESRPVKNGEVDAGSKELAENLRSWFVLHGGELQRPGGGGSAGAVLVAHLGKAAQHGSVRVKNLVAFVIRHLCVEQAHRRHIVASGGIRTLLGLVDLEEDTARDAARQALAQICIVTNPALLQYSEQLDAVRPLVQLLEHKHELLQFEAAMGLTNLLTASDELRTRAIQGDAWRSCRDLLFSDNEMVQRAGLEALCNLTMAPEVLERFADGKCDLEIKIFLSFSRSEDRPSTLAASGALAMLASCDEVAVQITKHENFGSLFDILAEGSDPDVQHRVTSTLCNIFGAEGCPAEVSARIAKALEERRAQGFASPQAAAVAGRLLEARKAVAPARAA